MRILSKYILKELVFPFFVALGLISFLLLMNKILTLVDLVLKHGVPVWMVGRLVLYVVPSTFAVTVPMSLLVAVLVSLGRLSADMELVAMKAGSISLSRLFKPLLWLGLAFSLGMLAFNEMALPRANQAYKTLFYDIFSRFTSVAIQENTYISDFENLILHVGSKDPNSDRLLDMTVIKLAKNKEPLQWIQARWGRLVSDKSNFRVYLELHDGTVQFLGSAGPSELTTLSYQGSTVDLDIAGTLQQVQDKDRQPQEMTIAEIRQRLKDLPLGDPTRFHFGVEMHMKIAIPFACLAFILIGFPLGLLVRKGGRMLGLVFAIALIFIYYLFLSMGQAYGNDGRLTPWVAMWLANLILMSLGCGLAWLALREKHLAWPR
jgi:lipopolysaccharide export system permease protein